MTQACNSLGIIKRERERESEREEERERREEERERRRGVLFSPENLPFLFSCQKNCSISRRGPDSQGCREGQVMCQEQT